MEYNNVAEKLRSIARMLIDQNNARIAIRPNVDALGYWFGGGNMVEGADGTIYLTGRYRNSGDSRTGLAKGERGLELAIFKSTDRCESFEKIVSFSKNDLATPGRGVLSIEGTALHIHDGAVELFVSSEKSGIGYPQELERHQKPGTGVWTIDRITANEVTGLDPGKIVPLVHADDPRFLHVKDPVIHTTSKGDTVLLFCTHPFSWTSANSGYAVLPGGSDVYGEPVFDFFSRGFTWDVAAARITDVLTIPSWIIGLEVPAQLVFYDGAECLRAHEENPMAVSRPRGYSCEELGGAAWFPGDEIENIERIEVEEPFFVSPYGTGCSRYVHTLSTDEGVYATWQQSQESGAQPTVINFVTWEDLYKTAKSG